MQNYLQVFLEISFDHGYNEKHIAQKGCWVAVAFCWWSQSYEGGLPDANIWDLDVLYPERTCAVHHAVLYGRSEQLP